MLARVAPTGFVLLWSSAFVTTKAGLWHISPLLFVGIRLAACAVVLNVLLLTTRRTWPGLSWRDWWHCGIAGTLLNGVALMAPHAGMLVASSAQVALVQSLTPLLTAALGVVLLREPLRLAQWGGLVLGTAGVALVAGQAALNAPAQFDGLVLAFVGVIGIVSGTLYFGRFCRGIDLFAGTTAQFTLAAVFSLGCAWVLEAPRLELTPVAVAALGYNTVMVSLGGMALYSLMLARGTAAAAAANFYLVPGAASVLAWLALGERLNALAVAGLVSASAGCWLVSRRGR
jgi:drug/metabolite transporter (DMT)-like permease